MIIGDVDDDEEKPITVSNIDKMRQYKDGDIVVTEDNRHKWISIFKSFDFINGVTTVYATVLLEPTPNGLYFNDRFIICPCRLATDIEKQTLINELKKDNRNEAKECLEKFFSLKDNKKMIPCVIHKDSQKLRNKLESFGYCPHPTMINVDEDNNWLMCNRDFYSAIPLGNKDELQKIVDCGDNEEYFLAMAELNSNNKNPSLSRKK